MATVRLIEHRCSLPPESLLRELSAATLSFEEMFDLKHPGKSYAKQLKESFTGDKTTMARIDGNEARLMPVGTYPFKGRSAIATSGYLSCQVEADGDGSLIRSAYTIGAFRFVIAFLLFFGAVMLIAVGLLLTFGQGVDGFRALVGTAGCFALFSFGYPLWILRGAKTQERLTREFLDDFVAPARIVGPSGVPISIPPATRKCSMRLGTCSAESDTSSHRNSARVALACYEIEILFPP